VLFVYEVRRKFRGRFLEFVKERKQVNNAFHSSQLSVFFGVILWKLVLSLRVFYEL